jgi:hypothetical protein
MQFRGHQAAFQGEKPQAYWLQVKGLQRRRTGKDATGLSILGLRIVLLIAIAFWNPRTMRGFSLYKKNPENP